MVSDEEIEGSLTPEAAGARSSLNLVRDKLEELIHNDAGTIKDALMILVS